MIKARMIGDGIDCSDNKSRVAACKGETDMTARQISGQRTARRAAKALWLGGAAILMSAAPAYAETAGAQVEELIVTAQKRAENVQSVPIAITALSAQEMERRAVTNLVDVARFTPGLNLGQGSGVNGGSSASVIFIRGVGQLKSQPTADPAVGIYVDGVYLGRSVGSVLDVTDIERVEVLRGPQGTLYGKNTLAGAINVVSKMPSGKFGGYIDGELGTHEERNLRGGVEFPIVADTLAARVSIASRSHEGYDPDTATGQKLGSLDQVGARVVLRWTPNDHLRASLIADATDEHDTGQAIHPVLIRPLPTNTAGKYNATVPFALQYDSRYVTGNRNVSSTGPSNILGPGKNANDLQVWGLAATVDAEVTPWATLSSITGYRWMKSHVGVDVDGSPVSFGDNEIFGHERQFSQELRLAGSALDNRLTWLVGAYYQREVIQDIINVFVIPTPPAFVISPHQITDLTTESWAVFSQETVKLTDKLSLTAGIRYSDESKDTSVSDFARFQHFYTIAPGTNKKGSWSSVTPKVSVDYAATDHLLFYASYAKGFKSGGTAYILILPTDFQNYRPEKTTAYEAGVKADLFDRRLRINSAFAHTTYRDLQFETNLRPGQLSCPTNVPFCSITVNAAKNHIDSFETEITAVPNDRLRFFANAAYTTDKFLDIDPVFAAQHIISSQTKLPRTPRWAATVGAEFNTPVADYGSLSVLVDYDYKTRTQLQFTEFNDPFNSQPAFGLLNARVAFESADGRWVVELKGRNLTNKLYAVNGNSSLSSNGYEYVTYGAPRTLTLGVKHRFGAQ
jgi:iron complex outermembrane receptor protein